MKKITTGIIAAVFAFALAQTARANFAKTNPVTGETESYTWKFVGTDTWNGTGYWQDSDGNNPSAVPAKTGSNQWAPILFDGSGININAGMPVEGWNLRMGVYNGATIQLNNFVKYQGGLEYPHLWERLSSPWRALRGFRGLRRVWRQDSRCRRQGITQRATRIPSAGRRFPRTDSSSRATCRAARRAT